MLQLSLRMAAECQGASTIDDNPYASPKTFNERVVPSRELTVIRLRYAAVILLAAFFFDFTTYVVSHSPNLLPFKKPEYFAPNSYTVVEFVLAFWLIVAAWLFLLPCLEWTSIFLKQLFRPISKVGIWKDAVYVGLEPAPFVAGGIAFLWFLGAIATNVLGMSFDFVALVLAIPANILLAIIYVRIIREWWSAARAEDVTLSS